jgi:hypothetical protein
VEKKEEVRGNVGTNSVERIMDDGSEVVVERVFVNKQTHSSKEGRKRKER